MPGFPAALARVEDAKLVVDDHVVIGRVAALDVVEFVLLVDVDEHVTVDRTALATLPASSVSGELADLARKRVILDLPKRYY